jgi:hypothetical protein
MLYDELQFAEPHLTDPTLREHPFAEKWHVLSDRHALEAEALLATQLTEQRELIGKQREMLVEVEFRKYQLLCQAKQHTDPGFKIPDCFLGKRGPGGRKRQHDGSWR